jgi:AbrB family looped-hinge helix DNA binding protein
MISEVAKIMDGNRLVIPASIRKALGLHVGDALTLMLENGELRVVSQAEAVRQAQALVRQYVPAGTSLVDDLLDERRQEAARD